MAIVKKLATPGATKGQVTTASLSDGKSTYNFLLDPETLNWSYQGVYSSNSVLLTSNPDNTFKSSSSSLSIPRVLFITQGMTKDISKEVQDLSDFVLKGTELRFSFGNTQLPRVYLTRFSVTEKQWRAGRCTQAEGSLDLLISREPVKTSTVIEYTNAPKYPTTTPGEVRGQNNGTPTANNKITERELTRIGEQVLKDLDSSTNRKKLKIPLNVPVEISTKAIGNNVSIRITYGRNGSSFFYSEYKEILGKK